MSSRDETDLVRSKEFLSAEQNASAQPIKPNADAVHDHSNGDTLPMNGENSNSFDDKNKQINTTTTTTAAAMSATTPEPTTPKPSTPSNWVQFDNEDDSDKVSLKPVRDQKKKNICVKYCTNARKQISFICLLSPHRDIGRDIMNQRKKTSQHFSLSCSCLSLNITPSYK